jgi:hypothetical protein
VDVPAPANAREFSPYCRCLTLNFLIEPVAPQGPAVLAQRTNVTVRNASTARIQIRYGHDSLDVDCGIALIATLCSALALEKGKIVNVLSRVKRVLVSQSDDPCCLE